MVFCRLSGGDGDPEEGATFSSSSSSGEGFAVEEERDLRGRGMAG